MNANSNNTAFLLCERMESTFSEDYSLMCKLFVDLTKK